MQQHFSIKNTDNITNQYTYAHESLLFDTQLKGALREICTEIIRNTTLALSEYAKSAS